MERKESKSEKFVRIVEARTNKIIDMIQLLGNCSNRVSYDYTKEDVTHIFSAIEEELRQAKAKFDVSDTEVTKRRFTLKR